MMITCLSCDYKKFVGTLSQRVLMSRVDNLLLDKAVEKLQKGQKTERKLWLRKL